VLTGNEREALLRVADRISIELGYAEGEESSGPDSLLEGNQGTMAGILNSEDELLVLRMRQGLAKVAAAAGDGDSEGSSESAVRAALDGTELVMRGELVCGNAEQLPALLPGFVFLVTLPVVEQDKALQLSRRTARLVERALGD
jgi:hypothetical protein